MDRKQRTMLRFGNIAAADHDKGLYRVEFTADELVSYWLSPVHLTTRAAKPVAPLSIGEHVACLVDEHCEDGVILGAIYSAADKPEGEAGRTFLDFLDNVSIEYNGKAFVITNNFVEVTVSSSSVTIEKAGDSLGAVLSDLIDAMVLETHPVAAVGSPTSPPLNVAAYSAIKTRLLQFLG